MEGYLLRSRGSKDCEMSGLVTRQASTIRPLVIHITLINSYAITNVYGLLLGGNHAKEFMISRFFEEKH
jgi:hypothetical protein